jgi:hypothetical protein
MFLLQLLEQNYFEPINNSLSGTELPGDIINSVDELMGHWVILS